MSELKFRVIGFHSTSHISGTRGYSSFRMKGAKGNTAISQGMDDNIYISKGGNND